MSGFQDEELDYISSSPLLGAAPQTVPQDEIDIPTLKRIGLALDEEIASYASVSRLTLTDKTFTVEQQLAINKAIAHHLGEIKVMIDTTISNVKEKYEQQ